jgi:hypothetical protein
MVSDGRKPAWMLELMVMNMGLYRRFYRQKWKAFAGAGDGPSLTGSNFSPSIIDCWRQPRGMLQPR